MKPSNVRMHRATCNSIFSKRDTAVTIPASLTFYLELGLEILLALTLCYCVILERRLAAVRKGQEGLSRTIGELNMAISGAGASLRALKRRRAKPPRPWTSG
jgi:hypothetical protein